VISWRTPTESPGSTEGAKPTIPTLVLSAVRFEGDGAPEVLPATAAPGY
jgi:hypothetical protein